MRRLVAATAMSRLGTEITGIAVPLAAVLLLHATAFEVGLLLALEYLPLAVLGLVAGVWVDRLPRRMVLISADIGRALVLATIPASAWLGVLTLAELYVIALAVGLLTVFFDVAEGAYVPSLVEAARLPAANSQLQIAEQGAGVIGPAIGGQLVAALGAPFAVAIDVVSYLVSALAIANLPSRAASHARAARAKPLLAGVVVGLRFVYGHPYLRALALSAAWVNLFARMVQAILIVYLVREGHLTPIAIGVVMSAGSVGFVSGAFIAPRIASIAGIGKAIAIGSAVASGAWLLIALPNPRFAGPAVAAGLFLYGVGALLFTVNSSALRQQVTPDALLGRVGATMRVTAWGTIPIAAVVGGSLGSVIGLRPTLLVAAAGATLAGLFILISPLPGLRTVASARDAKSA